MKIYLSSKDMQHKQEIVKAVDNLILHDVNFNGVEYEIIPDQSYTCVTLLQAEIGGRPVIDIIDGIRDSHLTRKLMKSFDEIKKAVDDGKIVCWMIDDFIVIERNGKYYIQSSIRNMESVCSDYRSTDFYIKGELTQKKGKTP